MLNSKFQIPKRKSFGNCLLGYGVLFGILCLVFGISTTIYALNLDTAKVYFLKGNYQECIDECEKILAQSGYSKDLDELYYLLGLSYLKQDNLLRASDVFEIIIKEFNDSKFTEGAYFGLGDVYFLKYDYENAQKQYKHILTMNPDTKLKSLLLLRLAQCAIKRGSWQQAEEYLNSLNNDYPLSFEKRLAENLSEQKFYFTVQVGVFSRDSNARNLCNELKGKDYPAYIEETELQMKKAYRVRVGKLDSRQQAKELEDKLIKDGYPTKIFP